MSHFIMSSKPVFILGTPNGQEITQLEQDTQRGLAAECTMPLSSCLIASAGQTLAQVGSSQCMQITGAVCTPVGRSTYSRWIIAWPRCVSHSPQAWTQAWQPIQRDWSMKNSFFSKNGSLIYLGMVCADWVLVLGTIIF